MNESSLERLRYLYSYTSYGTPPHQALPHIKNIKWPFAEIFIPEKTQLVLLNEYFVDIYSIPNL
jgi:hypothetical protein